MARPMPRAAPVTTAVLGVSDMIGLPRLPAALSGAALPGAGFARSSYREPGPGQRRMFAASVVQERGAAIARNSLIGGHPRH